jgi:hypothetical protein
MIGATPTTEENGGMGSTALRCCWRNEVLHFYVQDIEQQRGTPCSRQWKLLTPSHEKGVTTWVSNKKIKRLCRN